MRAANVTKSTHDAFADGALQSERGTNSYHMISNLDLLAWLRRQWRNGNLRDLDGSNIVFNAVSEQGIHSHAGLVWKVNPQGLRSADDVVVRYDGSIGRIDVPTSLPNLLAVFRSEEHTSE